MFVSVILLSSEIMTAVMTLASKLLSDFIEHLNDKEIDLFLADFTIFFENRNFYFVFTIQFILMHYTILAYGVLDSAFYIWSYYVASVFSVVGYC